ncbi:MAG: hypothetical protein Tsb0020_03160 [Haliangiales bacterium]
MTDLYSIKDVAQIFGLEVSRLRYWAQTGFVNPSVRRGTRVYYTFQDLVSLRTANDLLEAGLSMQKVRKNLESLRRLLPEVSRPASQMRIISDGETVVALDHGTAFEPTSGQVVMSFALDALSSEVADILALPTPMHAFERPADATAPGSAHEPGSGALASELAAGTADSEDSADDYISAYIEALDRRYDHDDDYGDDDLDALADDESALDASDSADHESEDDAPLATVHHLGVHPAVLPAARAAEQAAQADAAAAEPRAEVAPAADEAPEPSGYQCFLRACEADDRGETEAAEALYREAIARDPVLAAAYTNLGNLLYRGGDLAAARDAYEHALELEPAQAEARFNLGNALEDLGETDQAIAALRRVCWTHPDFADAHYNLGLVLARVGGITQARHHLERYLALETDAENPWVTRAQTFLDSLTGARVAISASR